MNSRRDKKEIFNLINNFLQCKISKKEIILSITRVSENYEGAN